MKRLSSLAGVAWLSRKNVAGMLRYLVEDLIAVTQRLRSVDGECAIAVCITRCNGEVGREGKQQAHLRFRIQLLKVRNSHRRPLVCWSVEHLAV